MWGRRRTWYSAAVMKARWLIGLACATLLGAGAEVRAADPTPTRISAADFLDLCQSNTPGPRNACGSLIEGFIDVYVLLGSKDENMRVICPPRRMPRNQARFVFNAWAEKRRDLKDMDVATAINLALRESFRCIAPPRTD